MPYCYGSVCQHEDEYDLMHCTCNPCDPIVAHVDLISRTDTLLKLLRDQRRERRADRVAVERLVEIARVMKGSTNPRGQAEAWIQVTNIAARLMAVVVRADAKVNRSGRREVLEFGSPKR